MARGKGLDELDALDGQPMAAFCFDDEEQEWIIVFPNGRRLTLSAGDDPYYSLSEVLH